MTTGERSNWKPIGKPYPTIWYTTAYMWRGMAQDFERQRDGGLAEQLTARTPMRQTIRSRSRYIPAGPHRNCPDKNTSAMVRVRKENAYYKELFA